MIGIQIQKVEYREEKDLFYMLREKKVLIGL